MSRTSRIFWAMLMGTALMFATGCRKDDVEEEGIYLGIIGFNSDLFVKDISLLNNSTESQFTDFISGLSQGKGTGLYYADYTALKKLNKFSTPPKLKNVALVTFTDGLDNVSISNSEYDPENYGSTTAYREALHNKIVKEKIHGKRVSAYTIGLKGSDVTDEAQFVETLKKLASNDNNVFQVSNMSEALQRFSDIAADLYSVSTAVNLGVDVPGGYDDGQLLRFTFDNASAATNSSKYIEATYKRSSKNSRKLENISYVGFNSGSSSITSSSSKGAYYHFSFNDLRYTDGTSISQSDINKIMLWKKTSNGNWDKESEFDPASSSSITEDKSSALIVLVLDCTTSLGNDFSKMQDAGKSFVHTLLNPSSNGGNSSGNGGDNGGGDNGGNTDPCDAPTGLRVTATTTSSASVAWTGSGTFEVSYKKASSSSWTTISVNTNSYTITGLNAATQYDWRVRRVCGNGNYSSWATSSFTTTNPPEGALRGEFSVSSSTKVRFSKGNLQYQASTRTWRFATNQYDYIGGANSNISSTYSGWIDLFAWGTSGWNSGANCYQPWSTSCTEEYYWPGGSASNDLTGSYARADWGVYNAISNGGNTAGQWRTLTKDEWSYLLKTRANASTKVGYASVASVNGLILLPDGFTDPMMNNGGGAFVPKATTGWTANVYTANGWAAMEAAGAVFLPAAGYRSCNGSVYDVGSYGSYWSSTHNGNHAWRLYFDSGGVEMNFNYRYRGGSVRLVQD